MTRSSLERRYRQLFEESYDAISISEQNGKVLAVNPAWLDLFGYRERELPDLNSPGLYGSEDEWQRLMQLFSMKGPIRDVPVKMRRNDGVVLDCLLSSSVTSDEHAKEERLIIIRDISEWSRALEALRQSEERYRDLFENANDIIYTIDLKGNFTSLNRAAERTCGYTREEGLGMNIADIVEPECLDMVWRMVERKLAGERPKVYEVRIRAKGGRRISLEISPRLILRNGQPEGVQGIARDVTERRRAEQALSEEKRGKALAREIGTALTRGERLGDSLRLCAEAMVKHLDAAFARIWILNAEEEVLELQASAGRYTHIGGPHSRIPVGHLKVGLIAQERRPYVTNSVIGSPRIPQQEWAEREGLVAFAGYPLIVEDRLVGVAAMFSRRRLKGTTLQALASAADQLALGIERKRAEELTHLLSAHLLRLQDEERRRLARELHDSTGQTLSALTFNLSLLSRSTAPLDKHERDAISEGLLLTEQCSKEIRTLSYLLHPPVLDELGLAAAVRWYAEGFEKRSGIRVNLDIGREVGRLPRDSEIALFRVVQEGLSNIHRHSGSPTAIVRILQTAGELRLEVSDQGHGMPSGVLSRARGRGASLGVGIAGMYERLKQLGGRLEIMTHRGGTTVVALLPVPEEWNIHEPTANSNSGRS